MSKETKPVESNRQLHFREGKNPKRVVVLMETLGVEPGLWVAILSPTLRARGAESFLDLPTGLDGAES